VAKVHHSAIVTRDVEASVAFWRDGLGLDVLMDTVAKSNLAAMTRDRR
jgi:catechol 2,3-dioxygenase-like lactoylglutathione lyase family enzyme